MREFLRKLFRPREASGPSVVDWPTSSTSEKCIERQARNLRDKKHDINWLDPPATMMDPGAWDKFWLDQIMHGVAGYVDLFVDDGELVDVMRTGGFQTVLCVGNGLSAKPRALAAAGFDVTALDLSPFVTDVVRDIAPSDDHLMQLLRGRSLSPNGRLEFVVGDLSDPGVCPGPFDVVIERRTLQLFPQQDRSTALQAVARRLAPRGIVFSHAHAGRWRPPAPRKHVCEDWFAAQGWPRWERGAPLSGRVAWLYVSTG